VVIAGNPRGVGILINQMSPWTAQISASTTSAAYGEAVTLTANLSEGSNSFQPPAGPMSWMAGNTVLGSSPFNQFGNLSQVTFTFFPMPGTYNITTKCVGLAPANSVVLNVAKGQSILTATVGDPIAAPGSSISFTASLTAAPPAPGTPTGTVLAVEAGSQLGSFALDVMGRVQGMIRETSSGVHTIQMSYLGDANFAPSSTAVTILVAGALAVVSAADGATSVAPGSIVSLYGANFSSATTPAASVPLLTTLAGVQVTITDSEGTHSAAPLYLVSPNLINAVVPQVALGVATLQVLSFGVTQAAGTLSVAATAPALFSANANGAGVAGATLLTFGASGSTSSQLVFSCEAAAGSCVATPLDLSDASGQYYLVLYGTGLGGASATALLGGAPAKVLYSGPQGQSPGLDQINVQLPAGVSGLGSLDVAIAAGSQTSNHVNIVVK